MTDIDALIAEANEQLKFGVFKMTTCQSLIAALTAERARVVELEGAIETVQREMERQMADATRWREVAQQCAEELPRALSINWKDAPNKAMDTHESVRCTLSNYRAALTAHTEARKESKQ